MKRINLALGAILCLAAAFGVISVESSRTPARPQDESALQQRTRALPDAASAFPNVFLRDVVVSNTDPNLKNTDKFLNSEPGIAVNPKDPRKIVISAFSGAWSPLGEPAQFQPAPIWYSQNGGGLWTKEFTISAPPGVARALVVESPCDETFDYGRDGVLYGTFLLDGTGEEGANCSSTETAQPDAVSSQVTTSGEVYSGATTNPSSVQAWQWLVVDGKTVPTNKLPPDQPWIIADRVPGQLSRESVYVAYQAEPTMQVAVASAEVPPNFTLDRSPGPKKSSGFNPGLRIAADHRTGAIYSLYQVSAEIDCSSGSAISYVVNRSLDGGLTWELNGSADGISAAQACSNQISPPYAFGEIEPGTLVGGVNPLRGGVDAIAVDSTSGDVYVVYGKFDETVGRDRIAIVRLSDNGEGEMVPGPSYFVSGTKHQSALPAVAVARDQQGTVAVLYDTADRLDPETGRPYFSVHLAISPDRGVSFQRVVLQTFLFPENAPPTMGFGPRPLGDYQQLKSLGKNFYGVFAGDGGPFGRPFHKIDPIFVKTSVGIVKK
jgi:hypothetical protein